MNKFIVTLAISIFSFVNIFAQNPFGQDYNYQGYLRNSNGIETVRASFYIAGEEFDPTTVFNPSNYPIWFKENVSVQVENGILNYTMTRVSMDSIVKYRNGLYLYVTVNGSPFDKVLISSVPYATHSILSNFAVFSRSADTASFSSQAQRSNIADSAVKSGIASLAINALNSLIADSALTVSDESITSEKIALRSINVGHMNTYNVASDQTVLCYVDGKFIWGAPEYLNRTTSEKTLTIPNSIKDNTVYFISQVAQDYSIVEPFTRNGRLIRIVNASTANTITVNWNNLFGGVVFIGPRSSVEFMYVDTEWIKL